MLQQELVFFLREREGEKNGGFKGGRRDNGLIAASF